MSFYVSSTHHEYPSSLVKCFSACLFILPWRMPSKKCPSMHAHEHSAKAEGPEGTSWDARQRDQIPNSIFVRKGTPCMPFIKSCTPFTLPRWEYCILFLKPWNEAYARWNITDPPFECYFTEVILPNNFWWLSWSPPPPTPCPHFPNRFEWSPLWFLPKFSVIPFLGS